MADKNVYFVHGTQEKFDALETKDVNTLYWLEDTQRLYNGDKLFGDGKAISGLTPVDASVDIGGEGSTKTIGVKIADAEGNQLQLVDGGLFVPASGEVEVPSYEMEKQVQADDGFAATYKLKKTLNGVSEYVGDPIELYKDLVLESGAVKTATAADVEAALYGGIKAGDKYLDLVIANATNDHIYIPVNDLVDDYTAGDGIAIQNNLISVENRTVEVLNGVNGKARIWNESDGGGVQFQHTDGTWSFVGVNDGGKDGITGQFYSVDKNNGNLGTRLNMTSNGFFYFKGKTSATAYTADDEIATKGDIAAAALVWENM